MVSARTAQWWCYGYCKEVKPLDWWLKIGDVVRFNERSEYEDMFGVIYSLDDTDEEPWYVVEITLLDKKKLYVKVKREEFDIVTGG